jgi:hypothetical protein
LEELASRREFAEGVIRKIWGKVTRSDTYVRAMVVGGKEKGGTGIEIEMWG